MSHAQTLTVAAASDLAPLEPELTQASPVPVRFVNAASGILTQQIENGAPYDVFLSANVAFIEKLASNGKMEPNFVRTYALGRVGILWRDGKTHEISYLRDLSVRLVAIPNPELAPYGKAAVDALKQAGLWNFVRTKVVYGENVRQTLQLFDSGNADAVLTSASLIYERHPDVIGPDVVQKCGIVSGTPNQAAAEQFLTFLLSPKAQAIFAKFGFHSPVR